MTDQLLGNDYTKEYSTNGHNPYPLYNASCLFAISQGAINKGVCECYWCGAGCSQLYRHEEPPLVLGIRRGPQGPKRPANPYICMGCWLWRRKRVTVEYLDKSMQDIQSAPNHSWFITESNAWALRVKEASFIYEKLLNPPLRFVLSFVINNPVLSGKLDLPNNTSNHLHLCEVNDFLEIKNNTPLHFTINNILHKYSTYELEEALKTNNTQGREPGVRALVEMLGSHSLEKQVNGRGRPKLEDQHSLRVNKIITESEPETIQVVKEPEKKKVTKR
jgi:hypothetical protein